jgi:hypothetical protein
MIKARGFLQKHLQKGSRFELPCSAFPKASLDGALQGRAKKELVRPQPKR